MQPACMPLRYLNSSVRSLLLVCSACSVAKAIVQRVHSSPLPVCLPAAVDQLSSCPLRQSPTAPVPPPERAA